MRRKGVTPIMTTIIMVIISILLAGIVAWWVGDPRPNSENEIREFNFTWPVHEYPSIEVPDKMFFISFWADEEGYLWASYNNGTHQFYASSSSLQILAQGVTFDWQIQEEQT